VLKAIGARDRDVLRIFLAEAGVLGLTGGALGTAAGWTVARFLGSVVDRYLASEGLAGVDLGVDWRIVLLGVVGSAALALAAGALPALRAARLPARDAIGNI
jgi:ABC-type antimicrobial peptide transport system permease subunit